MSRAHSPTFPSLHLRHNSISNPSVALPTPQLILQHFSCFTYVTAHSPTFHSLLLRHRFFTYVSWRAAHEVKKGMRYQKPSKWHLRAELILQPFHNFTYVTALSLAHPSLYLRHSLFSNPSVASPTSQLSPILLSLFLSHRHFTYVTWRAAHDVNNEWDRRGPVSGIYLFTGGHVLNLRSETVAVLRRMNMTWTINDVHMIRGDECGRNFLTFVSQLRKPAERPQSGNYPDLKYSTDTLEERLWCYLWATAVVRTFNKTKLFSLFHLTFRKQCK